MKVRSAYLIAAIALFVIEVAIALFVRDDFVRPYLGDVLVIPLIYTALRAVTPLSVLQALALTLAFAVVVEVSQAFGLINALALAGNAFARMVLGGSFDWHDLAAYAAGGALITVAETALARRATGRV